jgi:hypothetical protein
VPPERCPDCGRFLSRGFVAGLADRSAPCPRCGVELDPTMLVGGELSDEQAALSGEEAAGSGEEAARSGEEAAPVAADGPAVVAAPGEAPTPDVVAAMPEALPTTDDDEPASVRPPDQAPIEPSVRPPDLLPDTVRDDVLAGWDVGVGPTEMARWRQDRRPFPTDTVVVAGAAAAGLAIGAVLDGRRVRGAVLGAVLGAVAGAATRRLWRLEP